MKAGHPIILAHGIARFDVLRQLLLRKWYFKLLFRKDVLHYFRGIKPDLERKGYSVHHAAVPFAASLPKRSAALEQQVKQVLEQTGAPRVNIIAHSMGGLDARHMIIESEEMAGKVASLTTIGTPHRGTSFAEYALSRGGEGIIDKVSKVFDLTGFRELTIAACRDFNRRALPMEAANSVQYHTWSSFQPEASSVFLPLRPSWNIIRENEGKSDGLVPVISQRWVSELRSPDGPSKKVFQHEFPFPADHLNQMGWWDPSKWSLMDGLLDISKQIKDYEQGVKQVYREIARTVSEIE